MYAIFTGCNESSKGKKQQPKENDASNVLDPEKPYGASGDATALTDPPYKLYLSSSRLVDSDTTTGTEKKGRGDVSPFPSSRHLWTCKVDSSTTIAFDGSHKKHCVPALVNAESQSVTLYPGGYKMFMYLETMDCPGCSRLSAEPPPRAPESEREGVNLWLEGLVPVRPRYNGCKCRWDFPVSKIHRGVIALNTWVKRGAEVRALAVVHSRNSPPIKHSDVRCNHEEAIRSLVNGELKGRFKSWLAMLKGESCSPYQVDLYFTQALEASYASLGSQGSHIEHRVGLFANLASIAKGTNKMLSSGDAIKKICKPTFEGDTLTKKCVALDESWGSE